MHRSSRVIRIGLLCSAVLLLLAACGRPGTHLDGQPGTTSAPVAHEHASPTARDAAAPTDFSVYDITAAWRDQRDVQRELSSLAGRPQVVAMLYTHCAYTCPRILGDLKRIEAELGDDAAAIGFTIISIDPARDTPARLSSFAASTRLDAARWTLLTAVDDDAVLEIATLLGVRYRRVSDTEFEHSNVITILDATGAIVHRQVGVPSPPGESVRALRALLRG